MAFSLPPGFRIQSVDESHREKPTKTLHQQPAHEDVTHKKVTVTKLDVKPGDNPIIVPAPTTPVPPSDIDPLSTESPLGVLSSLVGTFVGTGFNMIFRPKSKNPKTPSQFDHTPLTQPPRFPDDNILQLSLTTEQLVFTESIGDVPNRGLNGQSDITLHGVGYLQTIQEVSKDTSGLGDGPARPIHFEPGIWLNIPALTDLPNLTKPNSITRMASIPHGTTINAQTAKPPHIEEGQLDIEEYFVTNKRGTTPFPINAAPGVQGDPTDFPAFKAEDMFTSRIPQDLTQYIEQGTITNEILKDPHIILNRINAQKKIIRSVEFTVLTDTSESDPNDFVINGTPQPTTQIGGGTANIDFLVGKSPDDGTTTNARASSMSMIFWISTVELDIKVPAMKVSDGPLLLPQPNPNSAVPTSSVPMPTFSVLPPQDLTQPTTITVRYVQLQYTQTVILNFAPLSWPHVSVATLVPRDPLPVPAGVWERAGINNPVS